MKAGLVSCSADVWLKTYSPPATDWPQSLVDTILRSLRNAGTFIDGGGWTSINDSISRQCNEDTTLSSFEDIAEAVATAAIAIDEDLVEKRIWTAYPQTRTEPEPPGCFPLHNSHTTPQMPKVQFCTVLLKTAEKLPRGPQRSIRLPEHCSTNDESECRYTSDEASATGVIGEFKLKDTNPDKNDVSFGIVCYLIRKRSQLPRAK